MGRACTSNTKDHFSLAWLICHIILLFWAKSPLSLLAAIVCHEAGHVLCGAFWGEIPHLEINGGGLRLCYLQQGSVLRRVSVSLAGPAVNIIAALALQEYEAFYLYSMALGIINLMPVSCLDGGSILRAICYRYLSDSVAYSLCRCISVISTLVIFALNCAVQLRYTTNLSLAAVSVYLTVTVLGRDN